MTETIIWLYRLSWINADPQPFSQARNMYMHRFGGIYADLDLVPLSPIPEHLPGFTPSSTLNVTSTTNSNETSKPIRTAYVGRMSKDTNFAHSIPNAFMATTAPGHAFWIRPMEFIQEHMNEDEYNRQPEALTGPVALRTCVLSWLEEEDRQNRYGEGIFDVVKVLEEGRVSLFTWIRWKSV
jgi:mannosyltransferase OCH1-like enzyme